MGLLFSFRDDPINPAQHNVVRVIFDWNHLPAANHIAANRHSLAHELGSLQQFSIQFIHNDGDFIKRLMMCNYFY